LITPPFLRSQFSLLEKWLDLARQLGFTAPLEGATHIHVDASAFASAFVIRNLINLLWTHGSNLRRLVKINPHCRRVQPLSLALWETVQEKGWDELSWEQALQRLKHLKLSKYSDFNFRNLVDQTRHKYTIEIRILPVYLEAALLEKAVDLIVALLEYSLDGVPARPQAEWSQMESLLEDLPLSRSLKSYWLNLCTTEVDTP
jgi:hypothetical protein